MIHPVNSSWIESVGYKRSPNGERYIALFVKRQDSKSEPEAILYGQDIPPYLCGLLCAGLGGGRGKGRPKSIGRAYHKLVKSKGFTGQMVKGADVYRLKEMMK